MTGSTHTYTAVLIGAPDVPLSVRGGRITLDSGRAPHVQGTLEIAWPPEATLTALDPRLNARVRVTADAVFPTFSQSRTFNLGLRSRPTRHRDAVVSLDLASDEALLDDYRSPSDDRTPRTLETSLRSIVNYALGKIGATLAGVPANDANMTAYWTQENLLINPRARVDTAGWTTAIASGGVGALSRQTGGAPSLDGANVGAYFRVLISTAAPGDVLIQATVDGITAGRTYTLSSWTHHTNPANRPTRVVMHYRNAANATTGPPAIGTAAAVSNAWTRSTVTGLAPAGTTKIIVQLGIAGGLAVGQSLNVTGAVLAEGAENSGWFDGARPADSAYVYAFTGTADASTSIRTPLSPLDARDPESLVWRAGDSALEFLHPIVQSAGYRLVCDENRTWTLRSSSYVAAGNLTFVTGLDLTDATDTLSREGDDWGDAQATIYTWDDANGITRTRVDYWALTPTPTKVIKVEVNAPYPGTGRSQYAVKRAQGRGRVVQAAKVADWSARAEQPVTVLLDGAPIQTGLTESVEFDLDTDEVTITTRTTDAVPGSIDLLAGSIDSLVGMINDL